MVAKQPVLIAQQGFLVGDITGDTAQEFDAWTVYRIFRLGISMNIRREAPGGLRISRRGFGKDRHYPVTSGWHADE